VIRGFSKHGFFVTIISDRAKNTNSRVVKMRILDLGTQTYCEVLELQRRLVDERAAGLIPDTLILVEHPPVFTLGRAGSVGHDPDAQAVSRVPGEIKVRKLGSVPVVEVERGGKLTFHGPGQIVGYPIFSLVHHDLRRYLRDMERILMSVLVSRRDFPLVRALKRFCLSLVSSRPAYGCATGKSRVSASRSNAGSYHGFALNISTDCVTSKPWSLVVFPAAS